MVFFRPRTPPVVKLDIQYPPSMVEVRDSMLAVQGAQAALTRAESSVTALQLEDALRSAEFFIKDAKARLKAGVAKRAEEVK